MPNELFLKSMDDSFILDDIVILFHWLCSGLE